MLTDILITVFLVLLNGFFVAAEFAIVKVRLSQIQVQAEKSFNARIAESVVSNLDGYLAATQLGITLASLGLGWVGESVVGKMIIALMPVFGFEPDPELAHKIALPIAFAIITVLHIVFGELAPKSLAIRFPTKTTLAVAGPLRVFYLIFRPFIWLLNGFANALLRLLGIRPVPHSEIHSEEELKMIISESAEGGAIEHSERELIQNVFDFDDRLVKQIITPRPQIVGIEVNTNLREAATFAMQEGYSRFPIYDDSLDNIIGYIHAKDLLLAVSENSEKTLKDILRKVLYVHSNKKVIQLLRLFQKNRVQMAIVTNEFGSTVGLVSLEDIVEELVGDIQDEHDTETPVVVSLSENKWRIQAQTSLNEINEALPAPFSRDEDYETLAGLLLKAFDSIPEQGQKVEVDGYRIEIIEMFKTSPGIVDIERLD